MIKLKGGENTVTERYYHGLYVRLDLYRKEQMKKKTGLKLDLSTPCDCNEHRAKEMTVNEFFEKLKLAIKEKYIGKTYDITTAELNWELETIIEKVAN